MAKRARMSRGGSRKNFTRNAGFHRKNVTTGWMRGGIRL